MLRMSVQFCKSLVFYKSSSTRRRDVYILYLCSEIDEFGMYTQHIDRTLKGFAIIMGVCQMTIKTW